MSESIATAPAAATAKAGWLALTSFAVVIAAFVSYPIFLDNPFLRRTAALTFALLAVAALLAGFAAWVDSRLWVRGIAGATLVLALPSPIAFFVFARLPVVAAAANVERAPDFSLPDHLGRTFSLNEQLGRGPVLITFYRGWW